jgi:predicted nicotinamide N-methyase
MSTTLFVTERVSIQGNLTLQTLLGLADSFAALLYICTDLGEDMGFDDEGTFSDALTAFRGSAVHITFPDDTPLNPYDVLRIYHKLEEAFVKFGDKKILISCKSNRRAGCAYACYNFVTNHLQEDFDVHRARWKAQGLTFADSEPMTQWARTVVEWKRKFGEPTSVIQGIFGGEESDAAPPPGQRLGIDFMRAQLEEVIVHVGGRKLVLSQSTVGMAAISTCVWDCGLLLADYLQSSLASARELGRVLDVGCGTGVAGLSALLLGAREVCFTDTSSAGGCLQDNLSAASFNDASRASFVQFDWIADPFPESWREGSNVWDTVLLSDVLYEQRSHAALMQVLRSIRFRRAIISYKRRHDEAERAFLELLETWCSCSLVAPNRDFSLSNLSRSPHGLFIIVAEPRGE